MATEELNLAPPQLLIEGAIDPHHFSLRPSQARMLEHATIVFAASQHVENFLKNAADNAPSKYSFLFNNAPYGKNISHGWLSPGLSLKAYIQIYQALSVYAATEPKPYSETAAYKKLKQWGDAWRTKFETLAGNTLYLDTTDAEILALYVGITPEHLKLKQIKHGKPDDERHCIAQTHGNSPLLKRYAQENNFNLIKLNLIGTDTAVGSEHYYKLMNGLFKQVYDCLT